MHDRAAILAQLKSIFDELFEVDPDSVTLEAHLYEDLDIDSIDAVDLVAHLQMVTGRRIEPEQFKAVRSVGDIVEAVYLLLNE
jgi:acyl carrier protein